MTRSVLAIAIATMVLGTAFAQEPTLQEGDSQAESPNRDTNRTDERFLKDFAQITAAEIYTGTTAEYKAEDAEVKAFATHMVDAHSKTIATLKTIAADTKVDIKAKPGFMQKAKSAFLDINVGASFDRAYMKATVEHHENVIEMLEREIDEGQDASVKQLAATALSDVQKRLQTAQNLRDRVFAEEYAIRSLARSGSSSVETVATSR